MHKRDYLPIGYSDIKRVIHTGYYVDKTKYAQDLMERESPIFITRPRRFRKSLFINTLATICSGEESVFKDCYIGKFENGYEWKKYPVINLNFSSLNYKPDHLESSIINALEGVADAYDLTIRASDIQSGLTHLVKSLSKLSHDYSPKIVILIDVYDTPVVNLPKGSDLEQANIKIMKDFFMTLKSLNDYFKLTFITGVSKFSLSDVFSGANHLDDITIDKSASAMFDYTEEELTKVFSEHINKVALTQSKERNRKVIMQNVMQQMRDYYNGYKFSHDGVAVYNPWSTLKFLKEGILGNYWYESGNPTLMINQILSDPNRFNLDELPIDGYRHELMYTGDRSEISLKSLMFQTGYLTIDSYDPATQIYKLTFPNQEVENAFHQTIQDSIKKGVKDYFLGESNRFKTALKAKDIPSFILGINIAFFTIPYYISSKREQHYHSNLHMLLYGLGFLGGEKGYMVSETPSSKGRADVVLKIEGIIYIIEIKYKSSGKIALQQIKENRYYIPYLWSAKEIILLGINFNEETRSIDSWEYEVCMDHLNK